jgi:hypothetical protein
VWEQIHRGRVNGYRDIQDVTRRLATLNAGGWSLELLWSPLFNRWFFLSLAHLCLLPFKCPGKEL